MIDILTGRMEHHISADIAYAVWQYRRATGDDAFFLDAGAEILLETARFWASRAVPEADGKRHIRHVIGPDEYHEDVDDNAFTNVMARWNIARGLETIELLRSRWPERAGALCERLALDEAELADWRDAVERIVTGSIQPPASTSSLPAITSWSRSISRCTPTARCRSTLYSAASERSARKWSSRPTWWR